jgi:hypothetical protein
MVENVTWMEVSGLGTKFVRDNVTPNAEDVPVLRACFPSTSTRVLEFLEPRFAEGARTIECLVKK